MLFSYKIFTFSQLPNPASHHPPHHKNQNQNPLRQKSISKPLKPTNHHSRRSTTPNRHYQHLNSPPTHHHWNPWITQTTNPPKPKQKCYFTIKKKIKKKFKAATAWVEEGWVWWEWERGRRWSRWETTFTDRGAYRHDSEAVDRGLGCGEIGVGLVGFIRDGFEHDEEAEAVQSDRRWVWAVRSDRRGRGSRTGSGLHRR